ncbi:YdcF family protein [Roseiconus lacunae]|uniref:YdcF family protein n=1 Tax=Roseiconus lacunae TaxID=2605694 RepID=A0ABT7PJP3_9BACT|nr:YdcF family protein [Roseiconus lacunae]MDM4016723.1 YdcF family protein [Roseiconus lacunae]WRQ50963.1 YdcF family protein [Stieleria sp. HD01]
MNLPLSTDPSSPSSDSSGSDQTHRGTDSVSGCGWKRSLLPAILVAGGLSVTVVGWTWALGGRALAERVITDLAMPVGQLWLLMLIGAITAYRCQHKGVAATCAFVFLFVSTIFNPMVSGAFYEMTELIPESDPVEALDRPLDTVVLLGGYARRNQFDRVEVSPDGHRLVTTAQLWHSGMTKSIICTGSAHIGNNHPSIIGPQLLRSIGVPGEIILGIPGENTFQEIESLEAFLEDPPQQWLDLVDAKNPRIGLVTSAYHMKRALRLAKTRDIEFIPIPCGFNASNDGWTPRMLVPSAGAGQNMAIVCKTFLAYLVGR